MANNKRYPVIILFILLGVISCGSKKPKPVIVEQVDPVIPERRELDPSPTKVVEQFLKALKDENFSKAYNYVYAPYVDRDGYVLGMKNTVKENQLSILNYRLLRTQVYDRTAIVIVELNTKLKSPKTGNLIEMNQRSKYDLGIFDDAWKVTSGICIQNCLDSEPEVEINVE